MYTMGGRLVEDLYVAPNVTVLYTTVTSKYWVCCPLKYYGYERGTAAGARSGGTAGAGLKSEGGETSARSVPRLRRT